MTPVRLHLLENSVHLFSSFMAACCYVWQSQPTIHKAMHNLAVFSIHQPLRLVLSQQLYSYVRYHAVAMLCLY